MIIIAGLIPLWVALFIAFSNMKTLDTDEILLEMREPKKETILELDLTEEKPKEEAPSPGLFSGLLGRFQKEEENDGQNDEAELKEDPLADVEPEITKGIGLPKGIKRLWGAAMVLIFLAILAYGSERVLDYAFKEYRWVIGTTNPWTSQLEFNKMATTILAALGVMAATLKTGIYLIRN